MTKLNIALPSIPTVHQRYYKHYYIIRDKKVENRFCLYLLQYEPAKLQPDSNGNMMVYQKYDKEVSWKVYIHNLGSGRWTYNDAYTKSDLSYIDFADSLIYNNFTIVLDTVRYEEKPLPEDGIVPAPKLKLPGIPNVHAFKYKYYYIVQDKKILETYYLYLLSYEPVSFENEGDYLVSYQKYGKAISHLGYTFELGGQSWNQYSGITNSKVKCSDLEDALIYNNFTMDLDNMHFAVNLLPEDNLVPAAIPEMPIIPNQHIFKYKYYYIVQNKNLLEQYFLYLLAYEPAKVDFNSNGNLVAYQKYGKTIHHYKYSYDVGSKTWRRLTNGDTMQKYNDIKDALVYNNFIMEFGELGHYDANPLPEDGLIPAQEPQFPGVPYRHNFRYKDYYVVQNKSVLEQYHLYLLAYEPRSMELDSNGYIVTRHKYGKSMNVYVYTYEIGQNAWSCVKSGDPIQSFTAFANALVHNNFAIDLEGECYASNPIPDDQIVPALEPQFPVIPNWHKIQYKHYFIAQSKSILEQYNLYLLAYEPAYLKMDSSDRIVAYQQYGFAISSHLYRYTIGEEEWKHYSNGTLLPEVSVLSGVLLYNNFAIDLDESEYYKENPLPDDQIIPPLLPVFPPVPQITTEENTNRYYILMQERNILENYSLYLLRDDPADYQLISWDSYVQFLNR